jgi:hypothetical protein
VGALIASGAPGPGTYPGATRDAFEVASDHMGRVLAALVKALSCSADRQE